MDWILLASIIVSLWVLSLCRILSCIPSSTSTFLSAGEQGSSRSKKPRNVLLVVGHPDDESMFFIPTILFLTSEGHNLNILCLSTGNADGKGTTRVEEFYRACMVLKVPPAQVKVLDNPNFQDGFDKLWDHELLSMIIDEEVKLRDISTIITFDKHGVSGHCNHCDVHHGVRKLIQKIPQGDIEAWELVTTGIFRKYSGPLDIWLSSLYARINPQRQSYCLLNSSPYKSYCAMAEHRSQWVWFRKLFVLFSSYTYINTVVRISF